MRRIVVAVVSVALLWACSSRMETGQFRPVDAKGWLYGDTVRFDIESADSMLHGDVAVVVRHTAAYPYSNIWLEISHKQCDSVVTDTANIVLADDFGNWQGRGAGLSFQRVDTVLRDVTIECPATIGVRHIMRVDVLTDIEQLGVIFISKNKNDE